MRTMIPALAVLTLLGSLPTAHAQTAADACTATGPSLGAARAAYADSCSAPRVDCDPSGAGWTCSSARIGVRTPGLPPAVSASVPTPVIVAPSADDRQGGVCQATGETLSAAKVAYAGSCSAVRVDCDPADGRWICASYRIGGVVPQQVPSAATGMPDAQEPLGASEPTPTAPTSLPTATDDTANDTYRVGDLIVMHWDSFPDIDDLQSMIAAREILDDGPARDVSSVAGTVRASFDQVRPGTDEINGALYGANADNALNPGAVERSAARWRSTLESGGTVHVAEGGPSDFTARVLRELVSQGVSGLKRVKVVQHSAGANEQNTTASAIDDVKRLATYVTIADGNVLNTTPGYLARSTAEADAFRTLALGSTYGQQWARAFEVARQVGRDVVDFSDAVELFRIIGLPTTAAPDVGTFGDRYLR